jgi:branched-chain amino acid transport system permease protein
MNKPAGLTKLFIISAVVLLLFLLPLIIGSQYIMYVLIWLGISIALTSSLRVISLSGLLSIGHGGLMLIGAYTSALLVMKVGLSSWFALILGGVAAGGFTCLFGFPFVRLKGMYFSMVTMFMTEVILMVSAQWKSLTGGSAGIMNIPRPDPIKIAGIIDIDFKSYTDLYYLILILVIVSLIVFYLIEHSRIGRSWQAISRDDLLAESVGINVAAYKVLGFTIGSFFAGVLGAFYSQFYNVITPSEFGFFFSIYILVYMIVGGRRSFIGPVIGCILLLLIPELIGGLGGYRPFIFVAILMAVLYTLPDGMASLPTRLKYTDLGQWFIERFAHA